MPLISLIITTYRQSGYVRRITERLVEQDLTGYEVIFSDDCSPDDTFKTVLDCATFLEDNADRVVCRRNERNLYAGRNRNAAAKCATGEYLWFFDCDDLITNGSCAAVKKEIDAKRPPLLYVGFRTITNEPRTQHVPPSEMNPLTQCVIPDTKIIRRDLFAEFGPWRFCEDFEWWFRQIDALPSAPVPFDREVVHYDRTSGGITDKTRLIGVNPRTMAETAANLDGIDPQLISDRLEQNASIWRVYHSTKSEDVRNAIMRVNSRPWLCITVI